MKKSRTIMSRFMAALLLCTLSTAVWAVNTKTRVAQVTDTVKLTEDVDYIIESATPFNEKGVVDIVNTNHAVLILDSVKPSNVTNAILKRIKINGANATKGNNCQVKLYNRGSIILPYKENCFPLTTYTEPNFQGDSCTTYTSGSSGGYMKTLNNATLNNRIRSFKLKRGYMVTFANKGAGRGYSRCFIAADKDLEVKELPGILDRSISSYRLFTWFDTGKVGLANDTRAEAVKALNVTSCYSFGLGESRAPDAECVPHHIYEDWPSSSACGQVSYSPHLKTNNEPRNSADDHPQTLDDILNNWENLMATGMRLCTPSSWDGSDYWNGTGFLKQFLDSIDARGWRCDIVDMHCYWPEGNFPNLNNWHIGNRPIWISEWCWGASWNNNGAFANGVTETQVRDALQRICNTLNNMDYVERYFYWNSERDPSKLYKNGQLTPAGQMYANLNSGVGYNGKYNYIPKVPTQRAPGSLSMTYDQTTNTATLSWYEYNGEMNASITVQRKRGTGAWEDIADIERKEVAARYTYVDEDSHAGDQYQVIVIDANNKKYTTNTVTAVNFDMQVGDAIEMEDGTTKYLGGNIFVNGDFDLGLYGWTDGEGNPIAAPFFQVPAVGSIDGGSYLQAYGHGTGGNKTNYSQAVKTVFDIEPYSDYYYSGSFCNGSTSQYIYCNTDGTTNNTQCCYGNKNYTTNWDTQYKILNSGENTKLLLFFRNLQRKAQVDKLIFAKLFSTREEAIADGVAKAKLRAEAFQGFNALKPSLNADLAQQVAAINGTDEAALEALKLCNANALKAYRNLRVIDSLIVVGNAVVPFQFDRHEAVTDAIVRAQAANTISEVNDAAVRLTRVLYQYISMKPKSGVNNSNFAATANYWTKCGTYTGGDQRRNTADGKTFWNAWWSGLNAAEGENQTMEIQQEVKNLAEGYYAVQCEAMTEHYCLSDQHAYITSGDMTAVSPVLTADYYDLPTVTKEQIWQKLTTTPVYVAEGGSVTIGFKSSKLNAVDGAWHQVGGDGSSTYKDVTDNREGWWGATSFVLNTCTPQSPDGILLPTTEKAGATDGLYTIDGRIMNDESQLSNGIYIRVVNGKARKIVIK